MQMLHSGNSQSCVAKPRPALHIQRINSPVDIEDRTMTIVTDFNVTTPSFGAALTARWTALREQMAKRALYRKTLSELQSLTGRELADLGIHRSAIRGIAYEAAFGE
jgi:uncharacterized protein YjiS (DUF1127 family)